MVEQNAAPDHPAKFSEPILDAIAAAIGMRRGASALDPFGGVGRVHWLRDTAGVDTYAIEIEQEWADQAAQYGPTWCGDFLRYATLDPAPGDWPSLFDIVVTSPAYGNRMADAHTPGPNDKSKRITYRHKLGRPLTEGNAGGYQWGSMYRVFHMLAWRKVHKLTVDGGLFVLNVSNHIRNKKEVRVAEWHREQIVKIGFTLLSDEIIDTPRMGYGANGKARVQGEHLMVFQRNNRQ